MCLEYTDSGTLYIFFKELEYGVKIGIEILQEQERATDTERRIVRKGRIVMTLRGCHS